MNGTGSLTKTGTADLTLSGANNFGGGLNINAGKLILGTAGATARYHHCRRRRPGAGHQYRPDPDQPDPAQRQPDPDRQQRPDPGGQDFRYRG
ncbi:hypothetical protein CSV86_029470 [Pseudomonas putida CSV86]|uniref:Uncharacterized protein n=1 Tax=Pseudomonas bharatica CSV86 TaxID=1005395 RepID=A0A7K4EMT7_9PSED|nr:autotransporter-associated beta strand repeat-containing protein [Pseudomonas bharatica]NNJ18948.1 hypothetical protein [Pseudomonas bharatica CSV86]